MAVPIGHSGVWNGSLSCTGVLCVPDATRGICPSTFSQDKSESAGYPMLSLIMHVYDGISWDIPSKQCCARNVV